MPESGMAFHSKSLTEYACTPSFSDCGPTVLATTVFIPAPEANS